MTEKVYEDKWLSIHLKEKKPKTKVFDVWSKCSGIILGEIKWYPSWRYYCYVIDYDKTIATEEFIYSDRCLLALSKFIEKLNKEHKEEKEKK